MDWLPIHGSCGFLAPKSTIYLVFPLIIAHCLSTLQELKFHPIKNPSGFGEMWLSDSGCGEVVEAAWRSCVSLDPNKEILGKNRKMRQRFNMVELQCIWKCEEGAKKEEGYAS